MGAEASALKNRDYILLLDKSGSMGTKDVGGKSRWESAKEATLALARKCAEFDPDGITVIPFAGNFKEYKNVKDGEAEVNRIFTENEPDGGTDTARVLQHVFNQYFTNKEKPIMILCVTDGEPNDKDAVKKAIIEATKKMDKDEEIGISFLQIGNDKVATAFLKELDDDLVKGGAKFDIVDTKTSDERENMTMTEVLLAALND